MIKRGFDKLKGILMFRKNLIFPTSVTLFVIFMSLMGLSGTSAGVYDTYLGTSQDNLLVGEPRTVRSDEWLVNTPFTVAQSNNSYPTFSSDIGSGQDMSIVVDVPYRDWSTVFKPQNWAFFIVPFQNAFAFKWWFLALLLVLAVYSFILLIYPKKVLLASSLSFLLFFSPFIQWWYQSITLLPIAYGLILLTLAVRLLREKSLRRALIYAALITFIGICFALVMYPAFQITVALVIVGLLIAILHSKNELGLMWKKRSILLLSGMALLSAAVVGVFVFQHIDSIRATLNTVYPGSRNVLSGGFDVYALLSWPLSYLLLRSSTASALQTNQSEASNFMLVGFVILPFLIYFFIRNRLYFSRLERYLIYAATAITSLFIIRMFVPIGSELFSLFGLSKVPHIRLFIGLGITNLVILAVAVGRKSSPFKSWKELFSTRQIIVTSVLTLIYFFTLYAVVRHYSIEFIGLKIITFLSITFAVPSSLLLAEDRRWRYAGLGALLVISFASSALANPIYRGALSSNPFVSYVQKTEKNDSMYWVSNNSPILTSLLVASGAETFGGVNTYPQTRVWQSYFRDDNVIFNRYAHIRFVFDDTVTKPYLELIQADSFGVHISPCDPFIASLHIGHIVSEKPMGSSCLVTTTDETFDLKHLYVYSVR